MNINKLTIGEVAAVEDLSGLSISALGDDDAPKGKALAALAFVIKKREDKEFTFADAMNLTMDEVNEIVGLNEEVEEDPKGKK